jgi:hypothetical protein
MSAFDEKTPFKKRIVSASLTAEQREEFDRMKERLHVVTDGALVKRALATLSHQTFENEPPTPESAVPRTTEHTEGAS